MNSPKPFFLPSGDGQRFCLYHPAVNAQGVAPLGHVVYVHPFGEEMNKSRRMATLQARALAQAGFSVLQVDLLGCGDSSGDFGDAVNLDAKTTKIRYGFMGPLSPSRIYEFDVETGELVTLKEDPATRWFDASPYTVERIEATAPDGEKVPVTLVTPAEPPSR